jgi:ferric-dicitrate binding protein FerR (iron transport regulator)
MQKERFEYLFQRYLQKTYTPAEREEFFALLKQPAYHPLLDKLSDRYNVPGNLTQNVDEQTAGQILEAILKTSTLPAPASKPSGQIHVLRKWGWAAAAAILIGAGAYLLTTTQKDASHVSSRQVATADIAPGRSGAVLTLANGRQVVLDSLENGIIATQNGSQVRLKNGQLAYAPVAGAGPQITYNTISTPPGRQFQLILPDGTRVWLNAASSLTYPTAFAGRERSVRISGEAYFEIARDEQMPFRVNINDAMGIQVLGTRFNVNAYADEAGIRTTLLEGAVRMFSGQNSAVLKPGQTAQVSTAAGTSTIKITGDTDPEKVLAWKNGLFNFENAGLEEVMRQLARWYDIEVVYEQGVVPPIVFGGKMSRDLMLSDLLKVLDDSEVRFRMEGRRLIVMP